MKNRESHIKEIRSLIDEGDKAIKEGKVKSFVNAKELTDEIFKLGEKQLNQKNKKSLQ